MTMSLFLSLHFVFHVTINLGDIFLGPTICQLIIAALIRLPSFSFRFFPASGPTCVLWRAAIGRQQQPSVGPRRRATISSSAVRLGFGRSLRVRPLCLLFSFAVVTPRHARHTGCDTGDLDPAPLRIRWIGR
jgi:hypothetical protein